MKLRVAAAAALLLAATARADAGPDPALADPLTFAAVRALITTKGIRTIEGLLPHLPESYRSRYSLMYDSRSRQGATLGSPRAILFGPDASFVLTFTGSAAQDGGDRIETLEVQRGAGGTEFVFREITFPPTSAPMRQKVAFSPPNPKECTTCHGRPPLPIWDAYPNWPGAYGAINHQADPPEVLEGLHSFVRLAPAHPRYRVLRNLPAADVTEFKLPGVDRLQQSPDYRANPNSSLTHLLKQPVLRALAEKIRKQPGYSRLKFALLAGAIGCNYIADFIPENLRTREFRRSWDEIFNESRADSERYLDDLGIRHARPPAGRKYDRDNFFDEVRVGDQTARAKVNLRYLTRNAFGFDAGLWSLARDRSHSVFAGPSRGVDEIAPFLQEGDEDLRNHRTELDCPNLKFKSLAALRGVDALPRGSSGTDCRDCRDSSPLGTRVTTELARATGAARRLLSAPPLPPLLMTCVGCHTGPKPPGPPIPFDDPSALADALRKPGYPRGTLLREIEYRLGSAAGALRMPPGPLADAGERESALRHLKTLPAPGPKSRTQVPGRSRR